MTNKSVKSEALNLFVFYLRWHAKGFSLKVDGSLGRKIYCLQACPCSFQPRDFTGRGSEGVNPLLQTAGPSAWRTVNCDSCSVSNCGLCNSFPLVMRTLVLAHWVHRGWSGFSNPIHKINRALQKNFTLISYFEL